LLERRCRPTLERKILGTLWQGEEPWQSDIITLEVNPAILFAEEAATFDGLTAKKDLAGLLARYSIKNTGVAACVAKTLRFQKHSHYEQALLARLRADETARQTILALLGDLPSALAEATRRSPPGEPAANAAAADAGGVPAA